MKTILYNVLFVTGLIALRMLFPSPAWFFLPKGWKRWLFGKSYSRFSIW